MSSRYFNVNIYSLFLIYICQLVFMPSQTYGQRHMTQGAGMYMNTNEYETESSNNAAEALTNALLSDSLKFIYTNSRGKKYELWKKEPGHTYSLFEDKTYATWGAKVSPDGKKVLYYKGIAKKSNTEFSDVSLYTMDIDGRNQREIIYDGQHGWISHSDANWSYSGSKIVMTVVAYTSEGPQLVITEADGTKPRVITERIGYYADPSFSPDDKKVVCVAYPDSSKRFWLYNLEVYTIDIETGIEKRLTYDNYADRHPAWSPDGLWIAFDSSPKSIDQNRIRYGLRMVPAQGGQTEDILFDENRNTHPKWLSDSRTILFERIPYLSSLTQLCTMVKDGVRVYPVTPSKRNYIEATFIP